jgi:hypothetical protein
MFKTKEQGIIEKKIAFPDNTNQRRQFWPVPFQLAQPPQDLGLQVGHN